MTWLRKFVCVIFLLLLSSFRWFIHTNASLAFNRTSLSTMISVKHTKCLTIFFFSLLRLITSSNKILKFHSLIFRLFHKVTDWKIMFFCFFFCWNQFGGANIPIVWYLFGCYSFFVIGSIFLLWYFAIQSNHIWNCLSKSDWSIWENRQQLTASSVLGNM